MKTILHSSAGKSFFREIITIILVVITIPGYSVLKTAICSGNYADANTWSPTGKPQCGDDIFIPASYTITLSSDEDYYSTGCNAAMHFTVSGTLYFPQTARLYLPCNSDVLITSGGYAISEDNNNSQKAFICGVQVWTGRDPESGPQYWYVGLLPIELLHFDVKEAGKKNIVKWETSSEVENDYFAIERSEDGVNFYPIKNVDTKALNGTSNSPLSYETQDDNVLMGTSYYRLKQIDIHNKITFSKIIALERTIENGTKFIIYPNPNHGKFFIDLKGIESNKDVEIKFYDGLGKLIRVFKTDAFTIQSNDFNRELGEFKEKGILMVEFNMDNKSYYSKLILQ